MIFSKLVKTWSAAQLRQFINGCHTRAEYDDYFDIACREFNTRFR